MNQTGRLLILFLAVLFVVTSTGMAMANVPGVTINGPPPPPAPNVATAGSQQGIMVMLSHRDTLSPSFHYVDHVMLMDKDKMVKEWRYDEKSAPTAPVWSEVAFVQPDADMNLMAVAHCTVHGYQLQNLQVIVLPQGTTAAEMMQTDAAEAGKQISGETDKAMINENHPPKHLQSLMEIQGKEKQNIDRIQGEMKAWMGSPQGRQFIAEKDQKTASVPA